MTIDLLNRDMIVGGRPGEDVLVSVRAREIVGAVLLSVGGDARRLIADAVAFLENPNFQLLGNLADTERGLFAIETPGSGERRLRRRQNLDHQIFELDDAPGVVLLQGKMPARESVFFVDEIHRLFVIDEDLNVVAFDDDVLGPPGVVGNQLLEHLDEIVETARADRIFVRVVDLRFVALRKSGAERGAEVHAGIAAVVNPDLGLELAIHALLAHVEEVTDRPVAGDGAVFDGQDSGFSFACHPLRGDLPSKMGFQTSAAENGEGSGKARSISHQQKFNAIVALQNDVGQDGILRRQ